MKKISRTTILQHYKDFFDLNELGTGEGDMIHIDWAEALLEDLANGVQASEATAILPHVSFSAFVCKCSTPKPNCFSGACETCGQPIRNEAES